LVEVGLGDIAAMLPLDGTVATAEQETALRERMGTLTFGQICSLSGVMVACDAGDQVLMVLALLVRQRLNERVARYGKEKMH
jgi:hypothetical protein